MYCVAENPHKAGLGFWAVAIPLAANVVGGLVGGDDETIDRDVYYPNALRGVIMCQGPFQVGPVEQAIANLDRGTQPDARISQQITSFIASDSNSQTYGFPSDARGRAGWLVARANGGRDCDQANPDARRAATILDTLLANEETKQRALYARAQAAAAKAQELATAEVIPGVSTPLLAVAGLGLALAFFRR